MAGICACLFALVVIRVGLTRGGWLLLWIPGGLLIGALGVLAMRSRATLNVRAHEMEARSATDLQAKDRRAPVLYLRSFKQDPTAARRTLLSARSEEQQMVSVVRRIGPVVAIGAPGEQAPTLGAARDYVPDEEWRGWVLTVMRRASLIIFRGSDTDAFWWEVATARQHVPPERTAFLLSQGPGSYSDFRVRMSQHLAKPLPDTLPALPRGTQTGSYAIDLWGLLYFDEEDNPLLRPIDSTRFWVRLILFGPSEPYRVHFERLFKPLLRRAGVRGFPLPAFWDLYLALPLQLLAHAWERIGGKPWARR